MIFFIFALGGFFVKEANAAEKVKISNADHGTYDKKNGYYVFEGNPVVHYKDYVISADLVEYYEEEERAVFIGNVVVLQGGNRIIGQKMNADLKDEKFIIDGNVDIHYIRKSKDDQNSEENKDDIIDIIAGHVEFTRGESDHLVATMNVKMEVKDQIITAEYLEYKEEEELVLARDNVVVLGEDDEKLECEEFTYRLEGEEEGFDANGGVVIEFILDDEEEEVTEEVESSASDE